ncbi:MAG: phosphoglycolate phosphatase [Pseudomonadota bacterium]
MISRAILFDLDGTLLDSAPDMVNALQRLLAEQGRTRCDYDFARAHVSRGAGGLITAGFPDLDGDEARGELRQRFLDLYAQRICEGSALFPGCEALLERIEAHPTLTWGIVTNKPTWLTTPLLEQLNLLERAPCVVCGDTLAQRKPDPAPLRHAAELLGVAARECIYSGDDQRDIQAAKGAEMPVVAAAWGYIAPGEIIEQWGADAICATPAHFTTWLDEHGWFDAG